MVSIILTANKECKERALKSGFKKIEVLLRYESCLSGKENENRIAGEIIRELKPFQVLVSDYWGMGVD